MSELISDNVLMFLGGLISGSLLTLIYSKFAVCNTSKTEENDFESDNTDNTPGSNNKLILAVRKDLKMGKGKIAAQCSHAAVMAHESCRKKYPKIFTSWKRNGQPKIVVKIDNEEEMSVLAKESKKHGLLVNVVQDAGRTQVAPGSRTVLAIGPGPESTVNQVTAHLDLL